MIFDSHVEQGRKSKQLEPLQLLLAFVYAFDLFAPVHGKWVGTDENFHFQLACSSGAGNKCEQVQSRSVF